MDSTRDSLQPLLEQLARPPDATVLSPGTMLGRYRIVSLLGKGGMGEVYCAHDARLGRDVAVKVVRAGARAEPQQQRRFETEAMLVGRLNHPNVLAIFDAGEHDGRPYLVTELLEGETLAQKLRKGLLAPRAAVEMAIVVGRALAAAHARGVVHRDLKPTNIFVTADGRIKVIDFGIAKWTAPGAPHDESTATGTVVGTRGYMSPEQARGESADARSDLFSLGVLLDEMVRGREPRSPGGAIPRQLQAVLHRCLAERPEDRFQSAEELLSALERISQEASQENGRHRWRTGIAVAGTAIAILAAVKVGQRLRFSENVSPIRSLVILPIEDTASGGETLSFGDVLTEGLTTDLSRAKGLRVISGRTATRNRSQTPTEIARALNVAAVLQGRVQRSADGASVELSLVRTTGERVWAEAFEGSTTGFLALQQRASRALRSALALPEREPSGAPWATRNPEAYDLYLRGKIRVRQESDADLSEAIRLLERSVELSPEFAAAHAELSHAYGMRFGQFAPGDAASRERAELAAEKALQLDPELAESHFAAAKLLWGAVEKRFLAERAVRELKRALALNPNLDEVHHQLGQLYLHIGLIDQGVAEFEKALELQPGDHNAIRRIGIALIYRGKYEEALRAFQQVPPESNAALWHYQVASTLLYLGRNEEAWTLMQRYLQAHPEDRGGVVTSTRAVWFAKAGNARRAKEDIHTAREKGKGFVHFHHSAYNIASAYALLGEPAPAVQWLRTAAETGWPCYPYFAGDPNLERIRSDPGYTTLMRELELQWNRYRAEL